MNHLWNLVKKEVKELLSPASVASVVAVCVVLIVFGSTIGGEINKGAELKDVGYIDLTEIGVPDNYSDCAISKLEASYAERANVINITGEYREGDVNSILRAMENHKLETCVLIPKDYNTEMETFMSSYVTDCPRFVLYWNQTNTSVFGSLSSITGFTAVGIMYQGVYEKAFPDNPEKAEKILFPGPNDYPGHTFFHGELKSNVSPTEIYSAISSQTIFVPIMMMLTIVMIGSILISSIGNEKENKTLETLLTLPISRTFIVSGKLVGCAITGVVLGLIYMIGMYFYIGCLNVSSGSTSLEDLGLTLSVLDWLVVALTVFLAIMCALGLCMILGAFAKNYKAAQTYIMPISVLVMIPMFVTMFTSFEALPTVIQAVLFLIPFTHPMMILQNVMFGNWPLIIGGLVYLVIFASLTTYITVRLYKSDILLTGLIKKSDSKKFSLSNLFNRSRQ